MVGIGFLLILLGIGFVIPSISADNVIINPDEVYRTREYNTVSWNDAHDADPAYALYDNTLQVSVSHSSGRWNIYRGHLVFNFTDSGLNNTHVIDYIQLWAYCTGVTDDLIEDGVIAYFNCSNTWNKTIYDYEKSNFDCWDTDSNTSDSTGWYMWNVTVEDGDGFDEMDYFMDNHIWNVGLRETHDATDDDPGAGRVTDQYTFNASTPYIKIFYHRITPDDPSPMDGGKSTADRWSMVSWNQNYSIGDANLTNGLTVKDLDQAVTDGWILSIMYWWNYTTKLYDYGYINFEFGFQEIEALKGYWLYTYEWCNASWDPPVDAAPGQTVNLTGLDVGRVLWYSFENGTGTTVMDRSGNGNHGVIIGAEFTPYGFSGYGMEFKGNAVDYDRVNCSFDESLNITGNRSVAAWVWIKDDVTRQAFLWKSKTFYMQWYRTVALGINRAWEGGIWNVSGSWRRANYSHENPLEVWHHIAYTFDYTTGNITLYVDGQKRVVNQTEAGLTVWDNQLDLVIGSKGYYETYHANLVGILDEVMIWNRTLSDLEVQELFGQHGYATLTEETTVYTAGLELEEETQMLLVLLFLWYALLKLSRTYVYLPFILGILQWSFVGAYYVLIDSSAFVALLMLIGFFFFLLGVYKTYKGI